MMHNSLKYARIEQERRFLLQGLPDDFDSSGTFVRIFDLYLTGTRLRLRRMESPSGAVLAYKLGQKYHLPEQEAHQSIMTNLYLNEAEYNLLAKLAGDTLMKRRHPYLHSGYSYGIDLFDGELSGLILAEIEQYPGQEIQSLPVPEFAVKEVTGEIRFSGAELAGLTRQEFLQWSSEW
jgi:CYTH domain-containing protein